MNMNLEWYFANITDEESAAALLREKGVFHREKSCLSCHQQMQLGIRRWGAHPKHRGDVVPGKARASTSPRHAPKHAAAAPLRVDLEEAVETR
ncbi:hypothetical protein M514_04337 [Trichuris suis]|uniref:Uncharacterized protein n=1 Tax=Trichuris suis TaxID=68888 RepID=A0A085MBP1_9BILA|nr:hypothetical protein M513_04337 [Trichuris suis]KFD64443.1 hypothetical protein M514_04337 [Trichuris suis]